MGSGLTPRARARRSVSSWSGTAEPTREATVGGKSGAGGTTSRPAAVSSGRDRRVVVCTDDRARGDAQRGDGPEHALARGLAVRPPSCRSGSAPARSTASIPARWPWRSVSRSRIAAGRWAPSSTLSTSSRAAGLSAPLRDDDEPLHAGERGGESLRLADGVREESRGEERACRLGVDRGTREVAGDCRGSEPSATGSRPCGTSSGPARRW